MARICEHPKRVLPLPPDITRAHSGAGWITEEFYKIFTSEGADVHVMPALGQHLPHTPEENEFHSTWVANKAIYRTRMAMADGGELLIIAPGHLSKEEVNGVCFGYADLQETLSRYDPAKLKTGFNTMPDGEEIYFISTPSAGLWSTKEKLESRD